MDSNAKSYDGISNTKLVDVLKGFTKQNNSSTNIYSKMKSLENFKIFNTENICFTLYGDGASNQGQVYESFNLAKIYNLPVVFICENNKYGMYTPVQDVSVDDKFYKRGYGIPGLRVCDSDVFLLIEVLKFAKNYVKVNGPIINLYYFHLIL